MVRGEVKGQGKWPPNPNCGKALLREGIKFCAYIAKQHNKHIQPHDYHIHKVLLSKH